MAVAYNTPNGAFPLTGSNMAQLSLVPDATQMHVGHGGDGELEVGGSDFWRISAVFSQSTTAEKILFSCSSFSHFCRWKDSCSISSIALFIVDHAGFVRKGRGRSPLLTQLLKQLCYISANQVQIYKSNFVLCARHTEEVEPKTFSSIRVLRIQSVIQRSPSEYCAIVQF